LIKVDDKTKEMVIVLLQNGFSPYDIFAVERNPIQLKKKRFKLSEVEELQEETNLS